MASQTDCRNVTWDIRSLIAEARLTVKLLSSELPRVVQREVRTELLLAEPRDDRPPIVDLVAQNSVLAALIDRRLQPSQTALREEHFWGPLARATFVTCRDAEVAGIPIRMRFLRVALADQGVFGSRVESALQKIETAPYHLPQTLMEEQIPRLLDLAKRRTLLVEIQRCEAMLRCADRSLAEARSCLLRALEAAK